MNDTERKDWINNDEFLYRWWQSSGQALGTFIKAHRAALTAYITAKRNAPPRS